MHKEIAPVVLAGFFHNSKEDPYLSPEDNYQAVKGILQKIKPGFVTLEVQPFTRHTYGMFEHLFSASPEHLVEIEHEALRYSLRGDEFKAGVIYCIQSQTPLYFVDFNEHHPDPLEASLINVTHEGKSFGSTHRRTYDSHHSGSSDMDMRNIFMGKIIDTIGERYPGAMGAHIGGIGHNYPDRFIQTPDTFVEEPLQNRIVSRPTLVVDFSFLK